METLSCALALDVLLNLLQFKNSKRKILSISPPPTVDLAARYSDRVGLSPGRGWLAAPLRCCLQLEATAVEELATRGS